MADQASGKTEQKVKSASQTAAQQTVGKAAAQAVTSRLASTAIGQALGSILPLIGNAIAALVGNLIGRHAVDVAKESAKAAFLGANALANSIMGAIGGLASAAASGLVGLSIQASATIAIGALVFGLLVSIILFIINSGAYIVPPGGITTSINPGFWPTIDVGASCPIPNGDILEGSYGGPHYRLPYNHGENLYWETLYPSEPLGCLEYSIPGFMSGGCYAKQPGDQCYATKGGCTVYGDAADFIYPNIQVGGQPVYLPYINGDSVDWTVTWSEVNSVSNQGRGILTTTHNGTNYSMFVVHLRAAPIGGPSGTLFGTLYQGPTLQQTPHLHVELRIDGTYVPPEFMCLGGQPGGGIVGNPGGS